MKTRVVMMAACAAVAAVAGVQGRAGTGTLPVDMTATSCVYSFSSGAGASLMNWCLTASGTLTQLESPIGANHLPNTGRGEGYSLCSGTTFIAYDFAEGGSYGWTPGATIVAGPSASGITLRRQTADGTWQLDQKFSRDNKENDITVTMTVKRLGATAVPDVRLARGFSPMIDGDAGDDIYDRSDRSVWAREFRSIALTNITFAQWADTTIGGNFVSCQPASLATPTAPTASAGGVIARLGTIGSGNSAKTTFVYRRM